MNIIIVDENDEEIGVKERDVVKQEDIYRVAALWVLNSKGDFLLARRSYNKSHSPGKWGPAVAGTVEQGETYDSNIIKEAEEELGLTGINPEKWTKQLRRGQHTYWSQSYKLVLDIPIHELKPNPEEVAEVKWFTVPELKQALHNNPGEFLTGIHERAVEL